MLFLLCLQIFVGEISMYIMKSSREALLAQEKTIVTGECCYLNPLIRRIIRFIGESLLFTTNFAFFITSLFIINTLAQYPLVPIWIFQCLKLISWEHGEIMHAIHVYTSFFNLIH